MYSKKLHPRQRSSFKRKLQKQKGCNYRSSVSNNIAFKLHVYKLRKMLLKYWEWLLAIYLHVLLEEQRNRAECSTAESKQHIWGASEC